MTNAASNALDILGLSTAAAPVEAVAPATETVVDTVVASTDEVGVVEATVTTEVAGTEDKAPKFEAGEVTEISFDELPAVKRAFTGGSKSAYGIEDLAAPGTDGKKYHGKLVAFEGGDVTAFKRSVQSSSNGQNAKAKEAGAPNYYVTRQHEVDGKFVGTFVIRTDERPAKEEDEAADNAA